MAGNEITPSVVDDLKAIFPQHNQNILNYVHRSVVAVYGVVATNAMVLPSCIERILELPEGFEPPQEQEIVAEVDGIIAHNNDDDSDMNSSHMSGVSEENENEDSNNALSNAAYRNKDMPRYRDHVVVSSAENSPVFAKFETNYFPDDGMDEVLLLENISTPAEQTKSKVLEENDDVLEVSITLNHSKRKNDSLQDVLTPPDRKKRKSSSDSTDSFIRNNSAYSINMKEQQSANFRFEFPSSSTPVLKKSSFSGSSTISKGAVEAKLVSTPLSKSISFATTTPPNRPVPLSNSFTETSSTTTPLRKSISFAATTPPNHLVQLSKSFTATSSATMTPLKNPSFSTPPARSTSSSTITKSTEKNKAAKPVSVITSTRPPPKPQPVLVDIANLRKGMKDFNYYAKKRVVSYNLFSLLLIFEECLFLFSCKNI